MLLKLAQKKLSQKHDRGKALANLGFGTTAAALMIGYPYVKSEEGALKEIGDRLKGIYGIDVGDILKENLKPSGKKTAVKLLGLASIPAAGYAAYRHYINPNEQDAKKYYKYALIPGVFAGINYYGSHRVNKDIDSVANKLKNATDIKEVQKLSEELGRLARYKHLGRYTGHAALGTAGGLALIGLANQLGAKKRKQN